MLDLTATNDTTLTPLALLKSLGDFDLDPCAFPGHQTATRLIALPDNGLISRWEGRVWCNPPYSEPSPWLARMVEHGNGIALVLASTDTEWFHDFVARRSAAVLFLKGRPKFHRRDMSEVGLMRATILVAFGDDNAAALDKAGLDGWLIRGVADMWRKPFARQDLLSD